MTTPSTPRLPVAVLGATGSVGQRLVTLLERHPWFELTEVLASPRSAGRAYGEAVSWAQTTALPEAAAALTVGPCVPRDPPPLVFSALGSDVAAEVERAFAAAGCLVVTNAAPHRMHPDVPLLVPEVNADHLALAERQAFGGGRLLANPNCSTIGLVLALAPLQRAFGLRAVQVVTLQALSGAGLPGVPALLAQDNVLPHIPGEEQKLGTETGKLLGRLGPDGVEPLALPVSAQCNRVPVSDGHTLCVSLAFEQPAEERAVREAWRSWAPPADVAALPSAPAEPLVLLTGDDGPQPRLHRDLGGGMSVALGRLRPCPVLDWRFVALSHNTVRGAAGGALLVAELARTRGLLPTSA